MRTPRARSQDSLSRRSPRPAFSDAALAILRAKKNLRLVRVTPAWPTELIDQIHLGRTAGANRRRSPHRPELSSKATRSRRRKRWRALLFGWKVCKHVKSNAIVYARPGRRVSVGAGQMSRVDSVKVGAMKAVLPLEGTVLASDAFFPFPDGVEEAAKHGVTAVIQPGGSVRDADVIAAADRLGLAMVFTGVRHFRH